MKSSLAPSPTSCSAQAEAQSGPAGRARLLARFRALWREVTCRSPRVRAILASGPTGPRCPSSPDGVYVLAMIVREWSPAQSGDHGRPGKPVLTPGDRHDAARGDLAIRSRQSNAGSSERDRHRAPQDHASPAADDHRRFRDDSSSVEKRDIGAPRRSRRVPASAAVTTGRYRVCLQGAVIDATPSLRVASIAKPMVLPPSGSSRRSRMRRA